MREINIGILIMLLVFGFIYGLGCLTNNETKITPTEIEICRFDFFRPGSTTYSKYLITGKEEVFQFRPFGTSVFIKYQENRGGVYWIYCIRKYALLREQNGNVTVDNNDGTNHYNQPYKEYKTNFEEAEKILQETRERFKPIIEKK